MPAVRRSLRGVTIGVVIVNLVNIAVVVGGMVTTHRASQRGEDALVALVDDVTRASQAQATAERMIAVGRSYLLTHEPELLARAQAAEAKLTRTVQSIATGAQGSDEGPRLDTVIIAAQRYRHAFGALFSGEHSPREAREVADALRKQLIPARDELLVALDALVAHRQGRLEMLRLDARDRRARALEVMVGLGVAGIFATILLVWVLVGRVRAAGPIAPEAVAAPGRPSGGARSRATQRMSHRMLPARFRQ
jgi:CHASE3 domain sensor protein